MVRYHCSLNIKVTNCFFGTQILKLGARSPRLMFPSLDHMESHIMLTSQERQHPNVVERKVVRSRILAQFWASLHPGFFANRRHQRDRELHAQRSALECMAPWLKSRMRRFTSN